MDFKLLARRLGISNQQIPSKAAELLRVANARLAGGGLGAVSRAQALCDGA